MPSGMAARRPGGRASGRRRGRGSRCARARRGSPRAGRDVGEHLAQVQQVGRLPRLRPPGSAIRRSAARPASAARPQCAPGSDSPERTGPEPAVMARWTSCGGPRAQSSTAAPARASTGSATGGCRGRGSSPRQVAGANRRDVLGDPVGEDQALEQRVGGQPVGAVDSGARALAAGIEPGERRAPLRSVLDAPAGVVLRRRDRQQVVAGSNPCSRHEATIDGNRRSRNSPPGGARRGRRGRCPGRAICVDDRAGDDVARREVGEGCTPCMNRTPWTSTRNAPPRARPRR
jgi:hypothetical protein